MPYIKPTERVKWDQWLDPMPEFETQGELAYVIYRLVLPTVSYTGLSHGRAVLKDLYDLLTEKLLDYERQKREENGDVL